MVVKYGTTLEYFSPNLLSRYLEIEGAAFFDNDLNPVDDPDKCAEEEIRKHTKSTMQTEGEME